jgi:glyoxylase-like metal-dependent hydrolase (beta-lactamase superfamily II)
MGEARFALNLPMHDALLRDVTVLERGWLSANNIVLHGAPGEGATVVDTGYVSHAEQTVALLGHALRPGESLVRIVNTHLHSDHCGGNAALKQAWPRAQTVIPPGQAEAVARWDEDALSYGPTGQRCDRFAHDALLQPGQALTVGERSWQAHAAPGHDPHSLVLFDAAHRVLISADALWEHGFGVVFPELDGADAFDDVARVLDLIERLNPALVLPGHGAPFTDVRGALQRARARLDTFRADPAKHAKHGAKVLVKYHFLDVQSEPASAFDAWFAQVPLAHAVWQKLGRPSGDIVTWGRSLVAALCQSGALLEARGQICNAEPAGQHGSAQPVEPGTRSG